MTKHNIYIGVNCTHSDQPKSPSNSSISLYTSIIYIFRIHHPKEWHPDISFSPHHAWKHWICLMPGVQVYHYLKTLAYQNQTQFHLTDTRYLIDFASMEKQASQ